MFADMLRQSRRAWRVFTCRIISVSLGFLLLMLVGMQAHANEIISCGVAAASPGATLDTFTCDETSLIFFKSFAQTPGGLNVGLGLTNNIAGNNTTQTPTVYQVIEVIRNTSNVDWTDFEIFAPNASLLSVVTFSGFDSCTDEIVCSGGIVPANTGSFFIIFNLGTPTDQNSGAFALFESPSFAQVPEPDLWTLVGLGLAALGWTRRRHRWSA